MMHQCNTIDPKWIPPLFSLKSMQDWTVHMLMSCHLEKRSLLKKMEKSRLTQPSQLGLTVVNKMRTQVAKESTNYM